MQNVFRMRHIFHMHLICLHPGPRPAGKIIRGLTKKGANGERNMYKKCAGKWNLTCYQQIALLCRLTAAEHTEQPRPLDNNTTLETTSLNALMKELNCGIPGA